MIYSSIVKEIRDEISIIKINKADKMNKLDIQCLSEIVCALKEEEKSCLCSVIILTAEGEFFCGGGELGDFRKKTSVEIREFGEALKNLLSTITGLTKPVIAAVNGHAHGGGFSVMEACDLALASSDATFAIPEFKGGLSPVISLIGVMQTVSRKTAMRLALMSDILSAKEALKEGIVNWICEKEELLDNALEIAKKVALNNPSSVALCKKLYNEARDLTYDKQLDYAINTLISMLKTENAKEVLNAREERRSPVWKIE